MSIIKVIKRKTAGIIGKALYGIHLLPYPKCKLPSYEESLENLKSSGYNFPPLWSSIPPLSNNSYELSIVIPVYNSERHLVKCLNSIMNQNTHFSYEVICINDGSTDGSSDILKQFLSKNGDKMIVHHQENMGISKARNQGIVMARGKYIGFIDNDDTVSQDYVEKIMRVVKDTDADIVQTAFDLVYENGIRFKEKPIKKALLREGDSVERYLIVSGYVWGGAIRKTLFSKLRFPENFWYEDMIMRVSLIRLAKIYATIPDMLYHKTSHSSNAADFLWKEGAIKNIDQYWLPTQIIKYQEETLNLPLDDCQYLCLLEQFSTSLWNRTHKLDSKLVKSLFVLAAEYVKKTAFNKELNDLESRATERVLRKKNYYAWVLLSLSRYYSGFAK